MAHSDSRRRNRHVGYHGGYRGRQEGDGQAVDHQDEDHHRPRQPEAGTCFLGRSNHTDRAARHGLRIRLVCLCSCFFFLPTIESRQDLTYLLS